jgi:hypothetical protein
VIAGTRTPSEFGKYPNGSRAEYHCAAADGGKRWVPVTVTGRTATTLHIAASATIAFSLTVAQVKRDLRPLADVTVCAVCEQPTHATESNDLDQCAACAFRKMTDVELKQSVTDFLTLGDAPTDRYRALLEAATLRTRMNPRLLDNRAWDIPAGTPNRGDIARARLAGWAQDGWSEPPQASLKEKTSVKKQTLYVRVEIAGKANRDQANIDDAINVLGKALDAGDLQDRVNAIGDDYRLRVASATAHTIGTILDDDAIERALDAFTMRSMPANADFNGNKGPLFHAMHAALIAALSEKTS